MIGTIHTALEGAVAAILGLPSLQRENTRNTTQAQSFTRFTLLPVETIPATLGTNGQDNVHGIAQVDVFVPIDGGMTKAHQYADLILSAFPRGRDIIKDNLTIRVERAWVEPGLADLKHYHLPITLRWRCLVLANP